MSVIRKKPFIEEVVDLLTISQKEALLSVMNTAGNNVPASLLEMPEKGIKPVLFKFDEANIKTGILIYLDGVPVTLIAYHRFQDVLLFRLYPNEDRYEKVNEYCDINELRRILGVGNEVTAGEINSGNATAGQVLAADGEHGAQWVNTFDTIKEDDVEEGDAVKLFGFDSEGNLVADDIPEGITVSNTLSPTTEDVAVSGKAVGDYTYSKDEIDAQMEEKANVDGNYPTMTVGFADALTPYDSDSGDDQDEPFSFQATGTGNGTQPDFATGSTALMKEKRGNTVVVNQWAKEITASNYNISGIFEGHYSISNNAITFTEVPANSSYARLFCKEPFVSGHKVLVHFYATVSEGSIRVGLFADGGYSSDNSVVVSSTDTNPNKYFIVQINQEDEVSIMTAVGSQTSGLVKDLIAVDLTQWFNGDIPAHLLSHPEDFFRYYQGSLAYNTGTLVNSNGRYLKTFGRNQWDEQTRGGYYDGSGNFQTGDSLNRLCNKNPIKVIPNTDYYYYCGHETIKQAYVYFYDKDMNFIGSIYSDVGYSFKTPVNCLYLNFSTFNGYGHTYNHDITISIYYEDESGYDKYYPYELLTNNDTGVEVLRSAGNVADIKLPSGEIKRNVGVYTFTGSESWTKGDHEYIMNNALSGAKLPGTINYYWIANITSVLLRRSWQALSDGSATSGIALTFNEGKVVISESDYANVSQLTGKTIYYELATPTTEQGTQFSENLFIDDFGSMDFQGTNGVPQGNLIFYPVDYKAFIDTLYNYTEGTPSNLALKSDLAKIYEHNITMVGNSAKNIVTLRLYNTSSAAITSISDLVTVLRATTIGRIGCTGGITDNDSYYNVSYWTIGAMNEGFNLNKCSDGTYLFLENQASTLFTSMNDEVRAIN